MKSPEANTNSKVRVFPSAAPPFRVPRINDLLIYPFVNPFLTVDNRVRLKQDEHSSPAPNRVSLFSTNLSSNHPLSFRGGKPMTRFLCAQHVCIPGYCSASASRRRARAWRSRQGRHGSSHPGGHGHCLGARQEPKARHDHLRHWTFSTFRPYSLATTRSPWKCPGSRPSSRAESSWKRTRGSRPAPS